MEKEIYCVLCGEIDLGEKKLLNTRIGKVCERCAHVLVRFFIMTVHVDTQVIFKEE
jgi:hypothetical protein